MTYKDAIDIVENCTTLACEYHISNRCEYGIEQRHNRFDVAIKMAVDAMYDRWRDITKDGNMSMWIKVNPTPKSQIFECPYCNHRVNYIDNNSRGKYSTTRSECHYRFCPWCGKLVGHNEEG